MQGCSLFAWTTHYVHLQKETLKMIIFKGTSLIKWDLTRNMNHSSNFNSLIYLWVDLKDKTCHPKNLLQAVTLYIHVMFFVVFIIMLLSYVPSLTIVLMLYSDHKQNFLVFDGEENTMDINLFSSFHVLYLQPLWQRISYVLD